jgi:hypothetical protein
MASPRRHESYMSAARSIVSAMLRGGFSTETYRTGRDIVQRNGNGTSLLSRAETEPRARQEADGPQSLGSHIVPM